MLLEWVGRSSRLGRVFAAVSNGFNDSIYLTRPNATQLQLNMIASSSNQVSLFKSFTMTDGVIAKVAIGWKANDTAWSLNGDVPGVDTSCVIPTVTRIGIGGDWLSPAASQPGVPLRRFLYWPYRLSNAALQTLAA